MSEARFLFKTHIEKVCVLSDNMLRSGLVDVVLRVPKPISMVMVMISCKHNSSRNLYRIS